MIALTLSLFAAYAMFFGLLTIESQTKRVALLLSVLVTVVLLAACSGE